MVNLSGYATLIRTINYQMELFEIVRTLEGAVWSRSKPQYGARGKWVYETTQDAAEPCYNGKQWGTHARLLELSGKMIRLPKLPK